MVEGLMGVVRTVNRRAWASTTAKSEIRLRSQRKHIHGNPPLTPMGNIRRWEAGMETNQHFIGKADLGSKPLQKSKTPKIMNLHRTLYNKGKQDMSFHVTNFSPLHVTTGSRKFSQPSANYIYKGHVCSHEYWCHEKRKKKKGKWRSGILLLLRDIKNDQTHHYGIDRFFFEIIEWFLTVDLICLIPPINSVIMGQGIILSSKHSQVGGVKYDQIHYSNQLIRNHQIHNFQKNSLSLNKKTPQNSEYLIFHDAQHSLNTSSTSSTNGNIALYGFACVTAWFNILVTMPNTCIFSPQPQSCNSLIQKLLILSIQKPLQRSTPNNSLFTINTQIHAFLANYEAKYLISQLNAPFSLQNFPLPVGRFYPRLPLQIKLAQLPAVDMQKVPGSFGCYSNHTPKLEWKLGWSMLHSQSIGISFFFLLIPESLLFSYLYYAINSRSFRLNHNSGSSLVFIVLAHLVVIEPCVVATISISSFVLILLFLPKLDPFHQSISPMNRTSPSSHSTRTLLHVALTRPDPCSRIQSINIYLTTNIPGLAVVIIHLHKSSLTHGQQVPKAMEKGARGSGFNEELGSDLLEPHTQFPPPNTQKRLSPPKDIPTHTPKKKNPKLLPEEKLAPGKAKHTCCSGSGWTCNLRRGLLWEFMDKWKGRENVEIKDPKGGRVFQGRFRQQVELNSADFWVNFYEAGELIIGARMAFLFINSVGLLGQLKFFPPGFHHLWSRLSLLAHGYTWLGYLKVCIPYGWLYSRCCYGPNSCSWLNVYRLKASHSTTLVPLFGLIIRSQFVFVKLDWPFWASRHLPLASTGFKTATVCLDF
ncbi:hypothetical protein VP01_1601g2 [Puccinia sorghi]|uniref:Uncharacterized protein n=1 Tax=Puccinia sorghi TaxID=27349 RepID=A0A0L6VHV5_9BASI|nr:hypothetical protein VP01_1601g2 [Puccinia sorghi]